MLASSESKGSANMETSTLDGEKHLKQRESLEVIRKNVKVTESLGGVGDWKSKFTLSMDLDLKLFVQHPNPSLYNFEGYMELNGKEFSFSKAHDSKYEAENLDKDREDMKQAA